MDGVNALGGLNSFLRPRGHRSPECEAGVNALGGLNSFLHPIKIYNQEVERWGVNALGGLNSFLR